METSSRMLSSRLGRPMSSAMSLATSRPITSTGLVAPKTSRGRSALKRQVQDKSYWMNIIRAKMNELRVEINRLSRECEMMRREEAQISVWQRKAESLAKELGVLSQELSIYNEYTDRLRSGESVDDVKEEILMMKEENEELHSRLEIAFEEKKRKELLVKNYETEIRRLENNWNNVKRMLTPEEREKFEELERENKEMSVECDKLEQQIANWKERKNKLEVINESSSDFFLRKETLQALTKLRSLEKQRNDFLSETSAEDERGRLLAQVKRDNNEIMNMETKIEDLNNEIIVIKADIEACDDVEAIEKYKELKKKEETIEEFLKDFDKNKEEEIRKLRSFGESINELIAKTSKYLSHIDALNSSEGSGTEGDTKGSLLDEKRKLELDFSKIEQLEGKINSELESLRRKIKTLETDIERYSDIPKLKDEIEKKIKHFEQQKAELNENVSKFQKINEELSETYESLKRNLEEDNLYNKMSNLEVKLSQILTSKELFKAEIDANDNTFIKSQVMDSIKKYNEKLLGF